MSAVPRAELNVREQAVADLLAQMRTEDARATGAVGLAGQSAKDAPRDDWAGARSELAWAKYLDVYPNLMLYGDEKTARSMDLVSGRVSVRGSARWRNLLVRPGDGDGRYVQGYVAGNLVHLCGWAYAEEVRRSGWVLDWNGRTPCFVLDQEHLRSPIGLALLVAAERYMEVAVAAYRAGVTVAA